MTEFLQRTEVVILDDSEQVRAEIGALVRKVFPDLTVNESGDADDVMRVIDEKANEILILISDSQLEKSIAASKQTLKPDGMDVVQTAKRAGVPHVAYYSINSAWAGEMMVGDGIVCITKPSSGRSVDIHKHPALKSWLDGIRATIFSKIQIQ